MKWIIEKDIFEENLEDLIYEITSRNLDVEIIKYVPFNSGKYKNYNSDCFFYGSIELAKQLRMETNCTIYYTPDIYNCDNYYKHFEGNLLNEPYEYIEYKDLDLKKDYIFKKYHNHKYNCIFIRPNSGDKIFTGSVICRNLFEDDIKFLNRYNTINPYDKVLVSKYQKIIKEFRFVIHNRKVITGSLYKKGNNLIHKEIIENEDVWKYVQNLLDNLGDLKTDDFWTIDICETNLNELKVLEIGCFSCAGLYDCNLGKIVEEMSS